MNHKRLNKLVKQGLSRKEVAYRMRTQVARIEGDFNVADAAEREIIEKFLDNEELGLVVAMRRVTRSIKSIAKILELPRWWVQQVILDSKVSTNRRIEVNLAKINSRIKELGFDVEVKKLVVRVPYRRAGVAMDPRVVRMLEDGLPVKEITARTGVSKYSIRKFLKSEPLSHPDIRFYACSDALALNEDQKQKLIRYEALGCASYKDLADIFQVSVKCVKLTLLKAKILGSDECEKRQSELENGVAWEPFQKG